MIAAYNAARWIAQAIESALEFDEILVGDDGSTDATAAIAQAYPVTLIQFSHRGYLPTIEQLYSLASGDAIAQLDADDWRYPDTLDKQLNLLRDADVVHGQFVPYQLEPLPPRGWPDVWRCFEDWGFQSNVFLWRREALDTIRDRYGSIFPEGKRLSDYGLALRAYQMGMRFAFCPSAIAIYRRHSLGITGSDRASVTRHCEILRECKNSGLSCPLDRKGR